MCVCVVVVEGDAKCVVIRQTEGGEASSFFKMMRVALLSVRSMPLCLHAAPEVHDKDAEQH